MELHTQLGDDRAAVLRLAGRLTMASAADVRAAVDAVVAAGRAVVVLDLTEVPFMDSSGLGALVAGLRTARAVGGDVRLAAPSEQVRTVLELTTMDRVFHAYGSVADALGAA